MCYRYYPRSGGTFRGNRTRIYVNFRWIRAYPVGVYQDLRLAHPGTSELHFQACSAARIRNVIGPDELWGEVPQLEQGYLDENTTHVSIGISGNDAGFGAIIRGCLLTVGNCTAPDYYLNRDGTVDPAPLVTYEPQVIDNLLARIGDVLQRIRSRAPNARIVLVGYPHVVWPSAPGSGAGCGFPPDNPPWFADTADHLTAVMQQAAQGAQVLFADPRGAFAGHEACTTAAEEWINAGIAFSSSGSGFSAPGSGSFHPKASGHSADRGVVTPVLS